MTSQLWKRLNGIFCIYKPPNLKASHVRATLIGNLVMDLNSKFVPKKENLITIEGSTASQMEVKISEKLAVHPLAIGEVYRREDIKIKSPHTLGYYASGVSLVGVNKAQGFAGLINHCRLIKAYRVSGILGISTLNQFHNGKVVEKSRYEHVTHRRLEKILMMIQATHQKRAMELLGTKLDTQGTYEALSEEGIIRPASDSFQLIYSLNCIEFKPPNFTLEVLCINEREDFLIKLIHDVGLLAKTNATTTKIQCIRYGPFTVDDALLIKHWRLENICDNIDFLRDRFQNIKPRSPSLKVMEATVL